MISNVLILRRGDPTKVARSLPIEEVWAEHLAVNHLDSAITLQAFRTSELVLFVDHANGDGRIKVLKNRRLPGLNHQDYTCVPSGTILPSDWFDNLVCGTLDLLSPRVVLPPERP